jgi:hypothetical protein
MLSELRVLWRTKVFSTTASPAWGIIAWALSLKNLKWIPGRKPIPNQPEGPGPLGYQRNPLCREDTLNKSRDWTQFSTRE